MIMTYHNNKIRIITHTTYIHILQPPAIGFVLLTTLAINNVVASERSNKFEIMLPMCV